MSNISKDDNGGRRQDGAPNRDPDRSQTSHAYSIFIRYSLIGFVALVAVILLITKLFGS